MLSGIAFEILSGNVSEDFNAFLLFLIRILEASQHFTELSTKHI